MVERNVLTNPRQRNRADTPVGTPSPSQDAHGEGGSIPGASDPQSQWVTEAVPLAHFVSILEAAWAAPLYWMPSSSERNRNYRLVLPPQAGLHRGLSSAWKMLFFP